MKTKEIHAGETYLFVATEDPNRQHLAGRPFTVSAPVYKNNYGKGLPHSKISGFKNVDGDFARADELEPLPDAPELVVGLRFFYRLAPGVGEIKSLHSGPTGNEVHCRWVEVVNDDNSVTESWDLWILPDSLKRMFEDGTCWLEPDYEPAKK